MSILDPSNANFLNPPLYYALTRRFGKVRVSNVGVPMSYRTRPDPQRPGRARIIVDTWGESYLVNCPVCYDTKQHLSVNHRFDSRDPATGERFGNFCVKCFRNDCRPRNFADSRKP